MNDKNDQVTSDQVQENEQEVIDVNESVDQSEENETEQPQEEAVENDEIAKLQQEKDETYNRLVRLQAEFDNYKRRTLKEREADRKYKSQDLITELLPAMDNFERALQVEVTEENKSIIDGIMMVYRQLQEALTSQGVEPIKTEGEAFDPNLHHAVMQIEDESVESNVVVEELQKGYQLKDRVIRPAMVKVNK
ncbi:MULTISPECIES: nucleotide exchange factor GrpE [Oceanobacillus]|uniref:Protein GrpE n=1 Tax=Oceanobacillus kimchii TaxID=746691 RepID=A0ABQ5TLJ3_9BACI|nr:MULTISPECIES: nucleotide exchange factor GrpE [Oceanobacillus]MBT2598277.1 nucleotide exchange factor GrpE [Oceanobacillus sp. ISL-74]MBT2651196.1 nucleotide exchange factor GrpE [Oceanobacillus sp. ISL-73]MCT1575855.1 nucleotide exchange factor GrpE [Oceanobacillus kimchii]MCT2135492.1 nucleotide exchange factor GrpE [Oceanobacillus kimchii]OEH55598.1 molecular chaperone GrpE [Oceanobacillus sp. E9]